MTETDLQVCIYEAERFLEKAKKAKKRMQSKDFHLFNGSKETGAVKRAALDLKMELSELNK